jgi:hypothetical protein
MFDELKTYGIISVLLILVLGYFVYIIYRDNILLKNNLKELKELIADESEVISEGDEEQHEHDYEDGIPEGYDYTDVDAYFSHIKEELPVIEEIKEEEEVQIQQEQQEQQEQEEKKKRKYKKPKKSIELVEEIQVVA